MFSALKDISRKVLSSIWKSDEIIIEAEKETKLNAEEILGLEHQELLEEWKKAKLWKSKQLQKMKVDIIPRKLTAKEIARLMYHSFRFSNWNAALQLTFLWMMHQCYGAQKVQQGKCEEEFIKLLKVWETEVTHHEHKIRNSGLIDKWTTRGNTPIALSEWSMHRAVSHSLVEESTRNSPLFSMVLSWAWYLERNNGRDGSYIISKQENLLYPDNIITEIFKSDFKYLLEKKKNFTWNWGYEIEYPGRPNRNTKHDWNNSLKDRYFSYFIWFILKKNNTGSEFFDIYFWKLQKRFRIWFESLPTEGVLPQNTIPLRMEGNTWKKSILTQEDVLYLITRYNLTHPDTQVDIEDIL